ncbi:MAG: AraC family transcriptional regulator [Verrucomicrobiota bacterium]
MELERRIDIGGVSCLRLDGRMTKAGSTWQATLSGEIWIWLNREGEGVIWGSEDRMFLREGMYAIFGEDEAERWRWTRLPGRQRSDVVVISRAWLARRIGIDHVHPDYALWLKGGGKVAFAGLMTGPEKRLVDNLAGMDLSSSEAALLIEAWVLEWAALRLYRRDRSDEGAGFCRKVAQTNGGPVERALRLLEQRLTEPINLTDLGKQCGISPTHLSRQVKRRTGKTLREHQRRSRIAAACELLRDGDASVTSVALDVGYQSLSHFAKAFREETGKTPREWRAS